MDYTTFNFEIKASADDSRTFSGYASTFGNVDSYKDTVAKGAFAASLSAIKSGAKSWPPMLSQHSSTDVIGIWTSLEEDQHGLKVVGKLANTRAGRDTYALLKLKALNGLSVGYKCTDFEMHGKNSAARRTIKAAELVEVSLVTFPANAKARVLSVKSASEAPPKAAPYTMSDLALADFEMLRRLTNTNRIGR